MQHVDDAGGDDERHAEELDRIGDLAEDDSLQEEDEGHLEILS